MGVQITFDYAAWAELFPQFDALSENQVVNLVLPLATQYCRNDGGGPVTSAAIQTNLLNLMVAHICQILYGPNGTTPAPAVGRISDATEGSVSVSLEFPTTPTNAWFVQTPFGAMFWQATAVYRTATYRPGNCGLGYYGAGPGRLY